MKLSHILITLVFSTCILTLNAQDTTSAKPDIEPKPKIQVLEDTLGLLAFTMVKSDSDTLRFAACRKFIPMLVEALKEPGSFYFPFDRLRTISTLYAPDSSFRIFTWQLEVSPLERRYFGAIQMNSDELELYPLIDRSFNLDNPQVITDNERWLGALYYKIISFESPTDKAYILLGYDHPNVGTKQKIMEILRFTESGPLFGAPLINLIGADSTVTTKNRFILRYDAKASVSLNYDPEMDMIVHDHIIPIETKEGHKLVPDGSYDGFYLKNGYWHHKTKIFNQILDDAPRPKPVLGKKDGRDLFGN